MPFNGQHKRLQDLMSEMWNGDNFVDTNLYLQLFSTMFENDREINEEDDAPYNLDQIIKFVNNDDIHKLFQFNSTTTISKEACIDCGLCSQSVRSEPITNLLIKYQNDDDNNPRREYNLHELINNNKMEKVSDLNCDNDRCDGRTSRKSVTTFNDAPRLLHIQIVSQAKTEQVNGECEQCVDNTLVNFELNGFKFNIGSDGSNHVTYDCYAVCNFESEKTGYTLSFLRFGGFF